MLVLDRLHPFYENASRVDQFYCMTQPGLTNLITQIQDRSGAGELFFLASMGDIAHDDTDQSFSPIWEALTKTVKNIGADGVTFRILGDKHYGFNPHGKDDYLLVGRQIPYSPPVFENFTAGMQQASTAVESGYVINRYTVANAVSPTTIEGMLTLDKHGYYTPRLAGPPAQMMTPQIASLGSASLLAPTSWPFMSTVAQQSAYTWISNQLCCSDIRASYVNLNVSPPVWLAQLDGLMYPPNQSSFSATDFNDVKAQLATEFEYVALVRNLQNNVLSLYQSQQSNVSLILQEATDAILSDIYKDTAPAQPPTTWSVFTNDVFPVLGSLSGFASLGGPAAGTVGVGIQTALKIGTMVISNTAERSNDASGASQLMHSLAQEDIAASQLAQHAADEFSDNLISLGNDFSRIVTDWGRLRTVAGPIATGQLVWDSAATGYFLRAFDLTTRRKFYPALMAANSDFFVTHISYVDVQFYSNDDNYVTSTGAGCGISAIHQAQEAGGIFNGEDFSGTAWYPGVIQISSGADDDRNPGAYWWDVWALGLGPDTNDQCPVPGETPMPSTFAMFDPIPTPGANTSSGLGLWKPYFFQYAGLHRVEDHNRYFSGTP